MSTLKNIEKSLKAIPKVRVKFIKSAKTSHLLINGDSLELLKKLPEKSIDLVITDPPYNQNLNYGKTYNDNKPWEEYYKWYKNWLELISPLLSDTGSFYLINYPEINARVLPYIEDELHLKLRRWLVWHYPTNIGHSAKNFTRSHRSILFFTKGKEYTFNRDAILQPYKNPNVQKIKDKLTEGSNGRASYDKLSLMDLLELYNYRTDILDINLLKNVSKDRLNKKHPCQLPFGLLRTFIKVSSNEGDIILDPFAGTFTLSKVAKELNRNSLGIEINPKYINLGVKRLEND